MKLNVIQEYILKAYAIVILFFTFILPPVVNEKGIFKMIILFDHQTINWTYLIIIYIGLTLTTIAAILAFNNTKKKN
ncbi:MAG: hypothetical protein ACOXZR_04095 [Bacilli bacterium]|jgi:hypothetical protein